MELINVETKELLNDLIAAWAMTWEGLASEDFETAMDYACVKGKEGTGYLISGKRMNELCRLTGDNAYPNDLNIFMIKEFKGLALNYSARWLTDVYMNNARRENYFPFGKKF